MAYNLLAVAKSPIDWITLSEGYRSTDRTFEIFPIHDSRLGDAVGVSIPTNFFNSASWQSAADFLTAMTASYSLEVFDMFSGQTIDVTKYVPDGLDGG
jgi:hypothetical protein